MVTLFKYKSMNENTQQKPLFDQELRDACNAYLKASDSFHKSVQESTTDQSTRRDLISAFKDLDAAGQDFYPPMV